MRIDREEKAARAETLFREGYNCAQSVVLAYAEEMGLEMKTAARLSSGFGGGVGGLYLGITGVGRYASGSPGLLVLPAYIGGDSMANLVNACIGTVIAMVVSFVVCYVLYGVWKKQGKLEEGE